METQETLLEQMGLVDEYKLIAHVGNKRVYAHTVYYEVEEPDYEQLITEDDAPVDNIFSEIQQRLLIDPLRIEKWTIRDFWASANVGIYYAIDQPCIVPDMFLSFDVKKPANWFEKKDKCYFTWLVGKSPDLVVEIVSNKVGNEIKKKMDIYASIGVTYYILIDSYHYLDEKEKLKIFILNQGRYQLFSAENLFIDELNLGILIWEGLFEEEKAPWARWCTKEGELFTTGVEKKNELSDIIEGQEVLLEEKEELLFRQKELLELEKQKAEEQKQLAELEKQKAEEQKRFAEEQKQLAELEKQKAEEQKQLVELERQKVEKLIAQLKASGLVPND